MIANPILYILYCVICVLWMILYWISWRFVFVVIEKMFLLISVPTSIEGDMVRSVFQLALGTVMVFSEDSKNL